MVKLSLQSITKLSFNTVNSPFGLRPNIIYIYTSISEWRSQTVGRKAPAKQGSLRNFRPKLYRNVMRSYKFLPAFRALKEKTESNIPVNYSSLQSIVEQNLFLRAKSPFFLCFGHIFTSIRRHLAPSCARNDLTRVRLAVAVTTTKHNMRCSSSK